MPKISFFRLYVLHLLRNEYLFIKNFAVMSENTKPKRQKVPGSGRKKGTPNKSTAQMKELFVKIIDDNVTSLQQLIEDDTLSGLDRLELTKVKLDLTKTLIPYVMPKQSESKITLDDEVNKAIVESLDKLNKLF